VLFFKYFILSREGCRNYEFVLHTGYWAFEQVKGFIRKYALRESFKNNHYKIPAPAVTFRKNKRFESTSCTVIIEFIP
jgi:hypothetical protein